ncbi:MAG: hypothetical protein ABI643_01755 [Candidatus Doudnabacteria bacterium]
MEIPSTLENKLANLDLEPIKVKLMDAEEGPGWSLKMCDSVEVLYKRFLLLNATHPHIVPTREIDQFWHMHILDTYKYTQDCEDLFGHYLHHFPYFGMRGASDASDLKLAFANTLALYAAKYGEPLETAAAMCNCCDDGGGVTQGDLKAIRPTIDRSLAM